ncbi:unnamed protein product [Mycena citricolor]|uniref:Uncharacterized protein n=1 Tax=Mycena citricolor TaxID=2018698 RepID=A0AAD2Q1E8_9AGAR|nr:unnamed protein product [Mycena citricolor]
MDSNAPLMTHTDLWEAYNQAKASQQVADACLAECVAALDEFNLRRKPRAGSATEKSFLAEQVAKTVAKTNAEEVCSAAKQAVELLASAFLPNLPAPPPLPSAPGTPLDFSSGAVQSPALVQPTPHSSDRQEDGWYDANFKGVMENLNRAAVNDPKGDSDGDQPMLDGPSPRSNAASLLDEENLLIENYSADATQTPSLSAEAEARRRVIEAEISEAKRLLSAHAKLDLGPKRAKEDYWYLQDESDDEMDIDGDQDLAAEDGDDDEPEKQTNENLTAKLKRVADNQKFLDELHRSIVTFVKKAQRFLDNSQIETTELGEQLQQKISEVQSVLEDITNAQLELAAIVKALENKPKPKKVPKADSNVLWYYSFKPEARFLTYYFKKSPAHWRRKTTESARSEMKRYLGNELEEIQPRFRRLMRMICLFIPESATTSERLALHVLEAKPIPKSDDTTKKPRTKSKKVVKADTPPQCHSCQAHRDKRGTKDANAVDGDGSLRTHRIVGVPYPADPMRDVHNSAYMTCGCSKEDALLAFYWWKVLKIGSTGLSVPFEFLEPMDDTLSTRTRTLFTQYFADMSLLRVADLYLAKGDGSVGSNAYFIRLHKLQLQRLADKTNTLQLAENNGVVEGLKEIVVASRPAGEKLKSGEEEWVMVRRKIGEEPDEERRVSKRKKPVSRIN